MFLKRLATVSSFTVMLSASAASFPLPVVLSVPENGSLRVTVKLLKPQVQAGHSCPVEMDVVNISSRPQTFHTYGCSWEEQWGVSDKRLGFPMRPCYWNPRRIIELKPGKTFRQGGDLLVFAKPGTVRFRVLFEPVEGNRFSSSVVALKVTS